MTGTKILQMSGGVAKCHAPESPQQALELRLPVLFQTDVPLKTWEAVNTGSFFFLQLNRSLLLLSC